MMKRIVAARVMAEAKARERGWLRPNVVGETKKKSATTIVMKMAGRKVSQKHLRSLAK